MKSNWFRKGLVVGIITLFIEAASPVFASPMLTSTNLTGTGYDTHELFVVNGSILTIDEGEVTQIGNSRWYLAKNRSIGGLIFGSIGGEEGENYSYTFKAITHIIFQIGSIWGSINFGDYEAFAMAFSRIALIRVPNGDAVDPAKIIVTSIGTFALGMKFLGGLFFTEGAKGRASVSGWIIPELDDEGHIVSIIAGEMKASGIWMPYT